MNRRVIIRNGKKYIVTVPIYGCGDDEGIGPGTQTGNLWMTSTDGNWYSVKVTGNSGSVSLNVSQSALTYSDNSLGYQLLACDDGKTYAVFLTGVPTSVAFTVSQSAFTGTASPKPDLLLQNNTDGNYYMVTLHNNAGTIQTQINQTPIPSSVIVNIS